MSLLKRYALFTCGVLLMSLGICLVIRGMLGTSPISAVPYVMSINYPYTLGSATFAFNMLLVAAQPLLLGRKTSYLVLLQIPVTFIFSAAIDMAMLLVGGIEADLYIMKVFVLVIGCAVLALGVSLEVIANVIMIPGEGVVSALVERFKLDFGYTKVGFDIVMVLMAIGISWYAAGSIEGVREGTLISALLVGNIVRFYLPHLSYMDEHGRLIFKLSLKGNKQSAKQGISKAVETESL